MNWPSEDEAEVRTFFGDHELDEEGRPTEGWLRRNLTLVSLPYAMVPSWEPAKEVTVLRCHRLVADSLFRVLLDIRGQYSTEKELRAARAHLCGGVYNYRAIAGTQRLSMHAFGAAIDIDPERNPLGVTWQADAGMIPMRVVECFEREGWTWGGRFESRPDCMHFQATAPRLGVVLQLRGDK